MEIYEIVDRYKEELDKIEHICNTTSREQDIGRAIPYVFHNTLEQGFMRLVCGFISEVAINPNNRLYADLRNEETHKLCKKIYELLKENGTDLQYPYLPMI